MQTLTGDHGALEFDIRRTIILGAYMRHWGMPEWRRLLLSADKSDKIELYYFPAGSADVPARFATVGLSACSYDPSGNRIDAEWMLALECELGGESIERVCGYVADLLVHHIRNAPNTVLPRLMPPSALAPGKWTTTALLLDEPRGEAEELEYFNIGDQQVALVWVLPITPSEAAMIADEGVESFDVYAEESEHSLIDPCRPI